MLVTDDGKGIPYGEEWVKDEISVKMSLLV